MILESDRNHYIKRPPVVPKYFHQKVDFCSFFDLYSVQYRYLFKQFSRHISRNYHILQIHQSSANSSL